MNKLGKTSAVEFIVGAALVLIVVNIISPGTIQSLMGAEEPTTVADVIADTCSDPSNTVTWGAVSKKWSPTTTISASAGTSIRYYLNGGIGTSTTSGSTKTLAWKDTVEGIYSYGSSADTTYYQEKFSFVMPCAPVETKDITNAELLANGSVTWENFNSDTGNKNAGDGSDNETIGTAETGEWDIAITTADKTGISTPGGKYMFSVEFNKSMYDESTVTLDGKAGVQVPQSYELANTDSYAIGWEFPACPNGGARRCTEDLGRLSIQADTGENPKGGGTGGTAATYVALGSLKGCILDQSVGVHTITDEIIGPAYVNNEGTALGIFGKVGHCQAIDVT